MSDEKELRQRLGQLKAGGETSFLAGAQYRAVKALVQLSQQEKKLKITPELVYGILYPSFTAEINFPVKFKGETYMCLGWRSWFDDGKPYKPGQIVKGGIRYLGVDASGDKLKTIKDEAAARKLASDDVFALGLEMLAKNSGVNFEVILRKSGLTKRFGQLKQLGIRGGSKGVIVGPRSSHLADHNAFVRQALEEFGYHLGLKRIVGWDRDVPAGDIATTGLVDGKSVLDGFVDGYERAIRTLKIKMPKNLVLGVATGKTADERYRGNRARGGATGYGTVEALRVWAEDKGIKLQDLKVVFDGAGNAALPAARLLVGHGIKVLGLTDSRSIVMCREGLTVADIEGISQAKLNRQSVADWAIAQKDRIKILAGKAKLWKESGMNVLFMSSAERTINRENVDQLPGGILIVDGANGPVTPIAEEALPKKKIDHLTGSFANCGGVSGSLVEWAANIASTDIGKEESEQIISLVIRSTFREMRSLVKKGVVESLADAFYYLAMKRVVERRVR